MRNDLAQRVAQRQVAPGPTGWRLTLMGMQPDEDLTELQAEIRRHRSDPWPDALAPLACRWVGPVGPLALDLPALPAEITRLDFVLDRLARCRAELGPRLSAHLVRRLVPWAERAEASSRWFPFHDPSTLLVHPAGALGLVGTGEPWIHLMLLGVPAPGARKPVEALQTLLLRLWSGRRHAAGSWRDLALAEPPAAIRSALSAGSVAELARALGPPASELETRWQGVLRAYVPDDDRGPRVLLRPGTPPGPDSVPAATAAPTRPARRRTSSAPHDRSDPEPAEAPARRPRGRRLAWAGAAVAVAGLVGVGLGTDWPRQAARGLGLPGLPPGSSGPEGFGTYTDRPSTSANSEGVGGPGRSGGSSVPSRSPDDGRAHGRRTRTAPGATEPAGGSSLVSVISQPSGATVEIDGGVLGTTPLVLRRALDARSYRVKVSKAGFRTWTRTVSVDAENGSLSVVADLEPQRP